MALSLLAEPTRLRTADQLDLETELERRPTMISDVDGADGEVTLVFDGKSLTFPARVREEVEYVARADERFRAEDLPGALDEQGRLVLVRRLVREGFLRVAG